MAFNTLKTTSPDVKCVSLDTFDFYRPWKWELVVQNADKQKQGVSGEDLERTQYLAICLDTNNITDHFSQVTDSRTIQLFKTYYGFDYLHEKVKKTSDENAFIQQGLLVFGTITNWKAQ